jgi:hypothetical protein
MRLFFCILIFLLLTVSNTYALDNKQLKIIETAFQNGFFSALSIDEKTYSEIKNDKDKLYKEIIKRSKEYLDHVKRLN